MSGSRGVAVAVEEAVGLALAEAEGLALGEALGLAEAEALEAGLATVLSSTPRACIPLSSKPRSSLAEAEALLIALVEAEALEAGLAPTLSSKPRSSTLRSTIPRSSKPPSSPWAAAMGANTGTANATDKTSINHLRIVFPLVRLQIHGKDAPPRFV